MPALHHLRSQISGPVLAPDDPGFAEELAGFNLYYAHRPEVVVGVADVADAVAAVRFATGTGMPVSVIATGHGSHAVIGSGMVITTKRLGGVSIDPVTRIASIGAGVRWGEVVAAAAELGLAPITGSSTNVGVVGYLLGGGLGPLARSHGFSSDYVRGYTVVTPAGDVVEASTESHPELFWALRGGKGGLGLVVAVRLELVAIDSLYAGALVFAEEHIETVLRGWIDYTATAPDEVTTSVAIMHFPPVEQVPEVFRGKTLLMLRFAFPGEASRGEQLVAPLRALAPAVMDGVRPMPLAEVATIHNDPSDPGPGYSRGLLLDPIDQRFATALLSVVGAGTQTPIMIAEVRHLGGATRVDAAGGSAVGGRSAAFSLSLIGAPNPALFEHVLPDATGALIAALGEWIAPETTINFAAGDEREFAKAWPRETAERLSAERAAIDPGRTFAYGPLPA
jgi:hypothetical protein